MKEILRELIGTLNKLFITHRKYFLKKSQSFGLYVGQPALLAFVRTHPGCTQTEIADKLGVSSASVAFSTKRLEKSGFLMKQINSLNMRCNKLYVTSEGQEVLDNFQDVFDEMNLAMFDGFSEEELAQLASFVDRVQNNIEKNLEQGAGAKTQDSGEQAD